MTNKLLKRIGVLINVALIIAAILFGFVLVRRQFFADTRATPEATSNANTMTIGSKLPLAGIDWAANKQTLLLALSKDCYYCSDSAPLYRRLMPALAARGMIRTIALLPETVEEGQKYLNHLGVTVDEVRQVSLASLGVRGTPTLILADDAGKVTDVWLGKLTAARESELLSRLQIPDSGPKENQPHQATASAEAPPAQVEFDKATKIIEPAEMERLLKMGQRIVLIDLRQRSAYSQEHIHQARNIPVDELEARAVNELSPDALIVTYCRCAESDLSRIAQDILRAQGFHRTAILRE